MSGVIGRRLAGAATAVAVIAAASCGSSKSSSSTTTSATTAAGATATTAGNGGKAKKIGVFDFSPDSAAAHAAYASTVAAFKNAGWEVVTNSADGDVSKANTAMQQFASQGVDAIVEEVFPFDSLGAGMADAKSKNIPVFSLGGGLGEGIVANLDAVVAGPSAEALLKDIGTQKANVLDMTYSPGKPCRDRSSYLKDQLAKLAGVTLTQKEITVPNSLLSGQDATTAFLQANPAGKNPVFITTCLSDGALGAVAATKLANRSGDVKIYTSDTSQTVFQAVKNGDIVSMLWQDMPNAGQQMTALLQEYFDTGKVAQPNVLLGTLGIRKDNAAGFLTAHPKDHIIKG